MNHPLMLSLAGFGLALAAISVSAQPLTLAELDQALAAKSTSDEKLDAMKDLVSSSSSSSGDEADDFVARVAKLNELDKNDWCSEHNFRILEPIVWDNENENSQSVKTLIKDIVEKYEVECGLKMAKSLKEVSSSMEPEQLKLVEDFQLKAAKIDEDLVESPTLEENSEEEPDIRPLSGEFEANETLQNACRVYCDKSQDIFNPEFPTGVYSIHNWPQEVRDAQAIFFNCELYLGD